MDLSVIIVNWNSEDFVHNCLKSIFRETEDLEFEVIVVDGGSFDGCGKMVEEHFPEVRFLQLQNNVGFAAANNAGVDLAKGRNVLFLNPDTEVIGDALGTLSRAIDELENPGVVGARLLNSDGSVQDSSVMAYPTILNQLFNSKWLRRRLPDSGLWGNSCLFREGGQSEAVEAISGACALMRRDICDAIGRFSLGYFMYAEDLDLSYKCTVQGRSNYYVPTATVTHHGDGSVTRAKSNFAVVMAADAMRRYFQLYRGQLYATLYRVTMGSAALVRIPLISLGMAMGTRQKNLEGSHDKWKAILRWALGREAWVLDYK
jgi:N-acetylglucosaminyl-diphospho-decaprenol L-rhamnosyltransferase